MTVRRSKKTLAAGASLALAAAMVGVGLASPSASVWAASTVPGVEQIRQAEPSPAPKPGRGSRGERPRGGNMQQHEQMHQAYLNALAGRLGLTPEQLSEAMKQARIDVINQAVAEGRLDQDRANQMIQAIQSGQVPGPGGPRSVHHGPHGPGPGLRGPGARMGPQVVADALGLTPEQLRTELQAGKSLAQIAEEKGVSRDDLKAKILEAQQARLDAAVAAGRMTAEQAQQAVERMTANVDRMLDATPEQRRKPRTPGAGS